MRSFLALAALALLFVGCTPEPADAQLLGRLLCRQQQQPQTVVMYARGHCHNGNNHNGNGNGAVQQMITLQYYWEHLAALNEIANNTAAINDELGRMNQNTSAALLGIRQAIVDQTELSLLEPEAVPLPNTSTMVIPAPQPMPAARTASQVRFARHSGIVSYYLR